MGCSGLLLSVPSAAPTFYGAVRAPTQNIPPKKSRGPLHQRACCNSKMERSLRHTRKSWISARWLQCLSRGGNWKTRAGRTDTSPLRRWNVGTRFRTVPLAEKQAIPTPTLKLGGWECSLERAPRKAPLKEPDEVERDRLGSTASPVL